MGERIELLVVPETSGQEATPPMTLKQWTTEDPQRAKDTAKNLLPLYLSQTFIPTLDGFTPSEIAATLESNLSTTKRYIYFATERLAETLGLSLGEKSRLDIFRRTQIKNTFEQAKQGDKSAILKLPSFWQRHYDHLLEQVPEEKRGEFKKVFIDKVRRDILDLSWQGATALRDWVFTVAYTLAVDFYREQERKQEKNQLSMAITKSSPSEGFLPIKDFVLPGISHSQLLNSIELGRIKGAVKYKGKWYLTFEIFQEYFCGKLLVPS